jgi:acyl carrier protein
MSTQPATTSDTSPLRQLIIDWLDDNYHFGDAERLIASDDQSFLETGVLDSLGFVALVLFLEKRFALKINRKELSPANFDSMSKIIAYLVKHPGYEEVN